VVLRVVLAEDNYLVREGLRSALAAYVDLELVAACADLGSLLDAVTEYEPDVVLTDIRMPPDSTDEGIRAANHLRGTYPHVGVVVLSQYDDAAYALALLKDGSAGRAYLLKERIADPDEIALAIREVARALSSTPKSSTFSSRPSRQRSRRHSPRSHRASERSSPLWPRARATRRLPARCH
jgi:DNA-binding NarL/FixJ family response regulator